MRGLQISVKGRLKGARRARAMTEGHGSVGPNSYKIRSRSNQQTIFTK
jgi:ribosomal protein S3